MTDFYDIIISIRINKTPSLIVKAGDIMILIDYENEFYGNLASGKSRLNGIKHALDTAIQMKDIRNALSLYYIFIREDVFECDGIQSVFVFSEYLALFESHPEYQLGNKQKIMWAFKWILGSIDESYQIPLKQVIDIYTKYGTFCEKFGYNKHSYYRKMWRLLYDNGIKALPGGLSIEDCHNKMMRCPIDKLSEVPAGECDDLVRYILFVENNIEKALKKAEPIFSGEYTCNVVPHYTYAVFAKYYFENGDIANAKLYAEKAYRIINKDFGDVSGLLLYKSICIIVFSYAELPKALEIFKNQFNICYCNKSGRENFYFYLSAYHLMSQLEKNGEKNVRMDFPDKDDPIYNEKGIYSVAELKMWMYSKAKFYADKFDERNGNDKYNCELARKYNFN